MQVLISASSFCRELLGCKARGLPRRRCQGDPAKLPSPSGILATAYTAPSLHEGGGHNDSFSGLEEGGEQPYPDNIPMLSEKLLHLGIEVHIV